jgi:hypothetical protein
MTAIDGKMQSIDGDRLYERAAGVLGLEEQTLRLYRSQSETLPLLIRINNLTWNHHREVASLKTIAELAPKLRPGGGRNLLGPSRNSLQELLIRPCSQLSSQLCHHFFKNSILALLSKRAYG